jgi:leader peptidase (prepilin peptidase)/N-methyltransferase
MSLGTCRRCPAQISLLYPGLELGFFAVALWASQLDQTERVVAGILLGWFLIALFAFDITAFVLPNFLTYSLLVSGVLIALNSGADAVLESAAGGIAGALCLLLVKYSYRFLAKRDGLGMGDIKLFAAAGAWVGPAGLPQTLLIGSLLGLIYAAAHLRKPGRSMALEKVPFGAGLCIAIWITWVFGPVLP